MKKHLIASTIVALFGLAGCASLDEEAATLRAKNTLRTSNEFMTGSRLAKPTTPHLVRSVGNDEYSQYTEHKGIANTVGARGN